MTWAQRLKRVCRIDIEVCSRCGGSVRVIACIEDQNVIDRILAHLRDKEQGTTNQSTTRGIASFRRKRIHNQNQQGRY